MKHTHSVVDTDEFFVIDPISRVVKNASSSKRTIIQFDHNSERISFECPRYVDGHDMSLCNRVEIHYLNVSARNGLENKGLYISEDLKIKSGETDSVVCSWLISQNATRYVGTLSFLVRFCCVEDGVITYAWNTAITTEILVSDGLNATETVLTEYADVLGRWKEELFNAGYINADAIKSDIAELNAALAVERKRIDQFVRLPSGSTVGDAELQDIRIGADGKVYPSAGAAVREQIETLTDALVGETEYSCINRGADELTVVDGYISGSGELTVNTTYKTYCFVAKDGFDCYFVKKDTNTYLSLALFANGELLRSGFVARYRLFEDEDTLPKEDSKLRIEKGQLVAISIKDPEDDFCLYTNSIFLSGYTAFKKMRLSEAQRDEINGFFKKTIKVKYTQENGVDNDSENLKIYIPTAKGYVRYLFVHSVNASRNADNWRLSKAYSVGNDLNERFQITNKGEWEMAIRLTGRDDFIGGNTHGDEIADSVLLFVDGKRTAFEKLSSIVDAETVRIVEVTKMYDPADHVNHVANHGKEYLFSVDGLRLRQYVDWLVETNVSMSYMTMFPVIRGNDAVSSLQVTDRYYTDKDFVEYDVSVGESGSAGYGWRENVTKATVYSEKSGFCGTVEVLRQTKGIAGGGYFMVQNTVDLYNKLYWTIAGLNQITHDTKVSERWETDTMYILSVTDGTEII